MDSVNAILLTSPAVPGAPYVYDDYGVKPAHCIPDEIPPFEYSGLKAFAPDGSAAPPATAEELRKAAELYHRIKLEL
jgi:primary-amine oxidase